MLQNFCFGFNPCPNPGFEIYSCQFCEGYSKQIEQPEVYEPAWKNKQWDYVQQLKAQMLYLEKRLNELAQFKKQKPKKTGYKGLR